MASDHLTLNGDCDNRRERILDLYAQGMVHDEISAIVGGHRSAIGDMLRHARQAGDPRAAPRPSPLWANSIRVSADVLARIETRAERAGRSKAAVVSLLLRLVFAEGAANLEAAVFDDDQGD